MRANEIAYVALLIVGLGVALVLELNVVFWFNWVIPFFAVFTLVWLVVIGPILRVSSRWLWRFTAAYLGALALIWYLPLNPIESFVNHVSRLHVGMPRAEAEAIMSGQVAGVPASGNAQLLVGKSYYEPHGQQRSFDTYCLVSWQSDRVSDIQVQID